MKKIFSLAIAALFAFSVIGCGGSSAPAAKPSGDTKPTTAKEEPKKEEPKKEEPKKEEPKKEEPKKEEPKKEEPKK